MTEEKLIPLVPVGSGSTRVTIPKELVQCLGGAKYVLIHTEGNRLVLVPAEIKATKVLER